MVDGCVGPRIVIKPSTAIFPSEISRVFPQPQRISISSSSCLVVDGAVVVKALHLDGAARFRAVGGSRLAVAVDEKRGIRNTGQVIKPVLVDESDVKDMPSEIDLMRGYVLEMVEERVECPPDDMDHVSHNPGAWVFNGQRVIPEAAYEDSVNELNSPPDRQCTSCLPSMC